MSGDEMQVQGASSSAGEWQALYLRLEQGHVQMMQNLSERLTQIRHSFYETAQVVQERFDDLREQRLLLMELADPSQEQEGLAQIRAVCQQRREDLQQYRQFLREQKSIYHQLRLDYQLARERIAAQRAALKEQGE